ncbi:hypothetical protein K466DRAFT_490729, partial [Polyporus arcularius HHB13444]
PPSRSTATVPPAPSPPLANFIAYALHRTRLHTSVTFAALYLLQSLKIRFPDACGTSGHRLFISAFVIASKVICDGTYSTKSWSIVGQGMFPLQMINNMEREMCSRLRWQLNVDPSALEEFEQQVRCNFKGLGPYLTYVLPSPGPLSTPSITPYIAQTGNTAPAQFLSACSQQQPSTSLPKPIPPPVPVHAGAPPYPASSSLSTPDMPDTAESSMSTSTSPASSAPPSTPLRYEDHSARVVRIDTDQEFPTTAAQMSGPVPSAATTSSYRHPKCGEVLARASPCVW